jgi:hypothetical protein
MRMHARTWQKRKVLDLAEKHDMSRLHRILRIERFGGKKCSSCSGSHEMHCLQCKSWSASLGR